MAAGKVDLNKFRNIGIIAHIDAGKTTTSEHILYFAGATHKLGGVDQGNTETDFDEEEQERGITIYSACIPFRWQGCTVNLIDTPGHVDFTAEVERALRVLDGCVVVFDAQKGVEAQSETVWRQANKYDVPRLVFINKMDVVGADFAGALETIRERLEGVPAPLVIPIGSGSERDSTKPFEAVIDLLEMKALYFDEESHGKDFRTADIPEDMQAIAKDWREQLFDVLTSHDEEDEITSAYLEGQPIDTATLRKVIRSQTLKGVIHPVLCGSGREHIGIQPLMDAACWYLPSPLDRPPVEGINPKSEKKETRKPSPDEPFSGLVFKIVADKHNEIFFLRIYSGTLKPQSRPWNPEKQCKELVSKIYHTQADPRDRDEVTLGHAGDIVALLGLKESITGDTLCDQHNSIILEQIQFAQTVVSKSIEPESTADKDKLTDRLNLLMKEDPTFTWHVNEAGQTLMNGMGVLHLEIKQHRLERDFNLKVRVGKPLVSYRETIKQGRTIEGECRAHMAGLFAKLKIRVEPTGQDAVTVSNEIDPEKLPFEFVQAAIEGTESALQSGLMGYPVMGVKATLIDAQMDQASSNEIAFGGAASDAVHQALEDNIQILEPIMKLEVVVPEEFFGAVSSDLSQRRAEIDDTEMRGKLRVIKARAPLASLFDYTEQVRSLSQGRATPAVEPHSYRPVPENIQNAMMNPEDNW